jgi:hypothetical protein
MNKENRLMSDEGTPKEQSAANDAKDTTTVEDYLSDGPQFDEFDPEFALQQALDADEPAQEEATDHEEELQHEEVDEVISEAPASAEEADAGQEEVGDGEADVGEYVLSADQYERIMDMLGLDGEDGEAAPATQEATAEEAPAPKPAVSPIESMGLKLPETDDELFEILATPEGYNKHVSGLIEHAVTAAIAQMEPLVAKRSIEAYAAVRFEEKFFEKNPHLVQRPALVNKAMAAAMRKLGPNASWDAIFEETDKNCAFADAFAKNAEKAKQRSAPPSNRFSPKTARKTQANARDKKMTPTEEAFADMGSIPDYDESTSRLLQDIGVL